MKFKPSRFFLKQLKSLSPKIKKIIRNKLKLVKINPARYKRIHGHGLFLFRIRIGEGRKDKRIIYLVDKGYIKVLCILDREKEYNELKRYLKKLGYK